MNKNVPKLAQKIDEFEVIPFLVSAAKIPLYLLGIWVTFSYVFWLCKGAADSLQHLPEMLIGLTCAIFAAEPTACKKLMSQEPEAVDTNEEQHCKEMMPSVRNCCELQIRRQEFGDRWTRSFIARS